MTKEEYEKKIAELQAQIDELRNERIDETNSAPPTPPHPRWKLEFKQKYYVVSTSGHPIETYWAGCLDDLNEYAIGNLFIDKQAAEFAIERLKVIAEMREWAGNWDAPYVLQYGYDHKRIIACATLNCDGAIKFNKEKDAENCIKAVGEDRIKKYYFMIS